MNMKITIFLTRPFEAPSPTTQKASSRNLGKLSLSLAFLNIRDPGNFSANVSPGSRVLRYSEVSPAYSGAHQEYLNPGMTVEK